MPTPARIIEDNAFYHLYNRGNHKEPIFHNPTDYERFLWTFADAFAEHRILLHAYCLMPNHYHALVSQKCDGSLYRALVSATVGYVKYYNKAYQQVGHLFQERYQLRRITTPADLLNITRYIHRNPLAIAPIDQYQWSSYRAYLGEPNPFCRPIPLPDLLNADLASTYATFCAPVKTPGVQGGQATAAQYQGCSPGRQ